MALMEAATAPLHPDLVDYVDLTGPIPMITHPLYHSFYAAPGWVNASYEHALERVARAAERRDWAGVVFTYARPYRAQVAHVLWALHEDFPTKIWRDVWVDSENINQCLPIWEEVFDRTEGTDWMTEEERAALAALPDTLTVWRGECDDGGYSWTTSKKVAMFFANRGINGATGKVSRRRVRRDSVWAYLLSRQEQEVLIK
jgi:hypothetical protein